MVSGSGWNLWVWLVGVVVRRYIDFLILFIPTPLVSVLFAAASLLFVHFFQMFITHPLYFKIYTLPLEGIQLMSMMASQDIKHSFMCASSCIKHYVQPSYGCCGTPVVARMCVCTVRKNYFIDKI